jgi:hypothetical protein
LFKFAIIAVLCSPGFGQTPEELRKQLQDAEQKIIRSSPSAFPQLPAGVTRELEARRCAIPQAASVNKLHNVIRGEFAKKGQFDWAVVCSVGGVSTILVFWNGSATSVAELARSADRNFLQGITSTELGYSRGIGAVGRDVILRRSIAVGVTAPPVVEHQGIEDTFMEKASITYYFCEGKWLQLPGAD